MLNHYAIGMPGVKMADDFQIIFSDVLYKATQYRFKEQEGNNLAKISLKPCQSG